MGLEPTTSSMPLRRAPNCAMGPADTVVSCRLIVCVPHKEHNILGHKCPSSGPGGIRTRGLLSAIEARSRCATGPRNQASKIVLCGKMHVKKSAGEGFTQATMHVYNPYQNCTAVPYWSMHVHRARGSTSKES